MYCRNCGQQLEDNVSFCPICGTAVNPSPMSESPVTEPASQPGKNRVIVGLMALFLGSLGIHNFYLGYTSRGLTQLLVSTIGGVFSCGIATLAVSIWALVEAIQIFTGTIATDAAGVPLHD